MPSELRTGVYQIRNGKTPAARALHEVLDLSPKAVFCPTDATAVSWIVEALPNGYYSLKAGGSPTAEHDGHVYAFLIGSGEGREWIITLRPDQNNRYTIQEATGNGWIAADTNDEGKQRIAVGPLPATKSNPPKYFDSALWTFEHVVAE